MRLLIDGYNLLHATDLFGAGELAGTLRGSREALLGFLAERLSPKERAGTVIVFDAADAPAGLADRYDHEGIDVRFARDHPDADAMIEALLDGLHRAKRLTVVSGDRRVQRAARSSGAGWIDSTDWFRELCRRSAAETPTADPRSRADAGAPSDWISAFSDPAALAAIEEQAAAAPPPKPPRPAPASEQRTEPASDRPAAEARKPKRVKKRRPPLSSSGDKPIGRFGEGLTNPFPEGYADDLLDGGAGSNDGDDPDERRGG